MLFIIISKWGEEVEEEEEGEEILLLFICLVVDILHY